MISHKRPPVCYECIYESLEPKSSREAMNHMVHTLDTMYENTEWSDCALPVGQQEPTKAIEVLGTSVGT